MAFMLRQPNLRNVHQEKLQSHEERLSKEESHKDREEKVKTSLVMLHPTSNS